MKSLKNAPSPRLIILLSALLFSITCTTVEAAKRGRVVDALTKSTTDSLVQSMKFQFEPVTLHGKASGVLVSTRHTENVEHPLWLLINMGGPMGFDTTQYRLNHVERVDSAWLINATITDPVSSGKFELQFIIEPNAQTLLKLTDDQGEKQLFDGNIYPYERMVTFSNERQLKKAIKTEAVIDSIVPMLTFQINYPVENAYRDPRYMNYSSANPSMYFYSGQHYRTLITPRILMNSFASIRYLKKVNGYWYLRLEYSAERSRDNKRSYQDYCINAFTGETFSRGGNYDRLSVNWRHYKDRAGYTNPA